MRALLPEFPLPMLLTLTPLKPAYTTAPSGVHAIGCLIAAGGSRYFDSFLRMQLVFAGQQGAPW